jgi:hypothetical protein
MNTYTPTISRLMPMKNKRWNGYGSVALPRIGGQVLGDYVSWTQTP